MTIKSLEDIAVDLASGQTSSRKLVEECLGRIEDPDGEGARAFLVCDREDVLANADAMDKLRSLGAHPGPFAGIPLAIKDLFDVRDQVTSAGSKILAGTTPAHEDAAALARLRAAGFIFIGRTNMTEFAYSGLGINPHYGTPKSPYEREQGRVPGGSSAGTAVAVADEMAIAGMGTDTGGSCRIPAAFCGVTGFKPSAQRVSREGVVPLSFTLDSIGPIARSVRCCEILDGILSGQPVEDDDPRVLSSLRLAVPEALLLEDLDSDVSRDFEDLCSRLKAAGAVVNRLPFDVFDTLPDINSKGGFASAEAWHWHMEYLNERADEYDPRVGSRIKTGEKQSAADYIELLQIRQEVIAEIVEDLDGYDAMLSPTVAIIPPLIDSFAGPGSEEHYGQQNLLVLRNTSAMNFIDACSISLPMHGPGNAPTGLMLTAMNGEDRSLFAIARAVEPLSRNTK